TYFGKERPLANALALGVLDGVAAEVKHAEAAVGHGVAVQQSVDVGFELEIIFQVNEVIRVERARLVEIVALAGQRRSTRRAGGKQRSGAGVTRIGQAIGPAEGREICREVVSYIISFQHVERFVL